eukprot:4886334-Pleurochrysis_carterae.AAC.2
MQAGDLSEKEVSLLLSIPDDEENFHLRAWLADSILRAEVGSVVVVDVSSKLPLADSFAEGNTAEKILAATYLTGELRCDSAFAWTLASKEGTPSLPFAYTYASDEELTDVLFNHFARGYLRRSTSMPDDLAQVEPPPNAKAVNPSIGAGSVLSSDATSLPAVNSLIASSRSKQPHLGSASDVGSAPLIDATLDISATVAPSGTSLLVSTALEDGGFLATGAAVLASSQAAIGLPLAEQDAVVTTASSAQPAADPVAISSSTTAEAVVHHASNASAFAEAVSLPPVGRRCVLPCTEPNSVVPGESDGSRSALAFKVNDKKQEVLFAYDNFEWEPVSYAHGAFTGSVKPCNEHAAGVHFVLRSRLGQKLPEAYLTGPCGLHYADES